MGSTFLPLPSPLSPSPALYWYMPSPLCTMVEMLRDDLLRAVRCVALRAVRCVRCVACAASSTREQEHTSLYTCVLSYLLFLSSEMVYKAYGCIVVDTETRSIKSVHIPVCKLSCASLYCYDILLFWFVISQNYTTTLRYIELNMCHCTTSASPLSTLYLFTLNLSFQKENNTPASFKCSCC